MRTFRRATTAILAATLIVAGAAPATATFAGQPDRILFMRDRANGNAAIFGMDPDGRRVRPLTSGELGNDADPRWSPDGRAIVFASDRDGDWEVFRMAPDGGTIRKLTRNAAADTQPTWSPDGRSIAFVSTRKGSAELFTMRADGSRVRRVTREAGFVFLATWSPDGRRIAYGALDGMDLEIFSIRPDGTRRRNLTRTSGLDGLGDWSPDGRRIVFHSRRLVGMEGLIWTMSPDGSDPEQVTATGDQLFPMWLPKGQRIVYQQSDGSDFELFTIRPDGTGKRRLTRNTQNERLVWD